MAVNALGVDRIAALEIDRDRKLDRFTIRSALASAKSIGTSWPSPKPLAIGDRCAAGRDRLCTGLGDRLGAARVPGVEQHQRIAGDVKLREIIELAHDGLSPPDVASVLRQIGCRRLSILALNTQAQFIACAAPSLSASPSARDAGRGRG